MRNALAEVNETIDEDDKIEYGKNVSLLGDDGIDSFAFVCLISSVEEEIETVCGKTINLMDDQSLFEDNNRNPFETMSMLEQYISEKMTGALLCLKK